MVHKIRIEFDKNVLIDFDGVIEKNLAECKYLNFLDSKISIFTGEFSGNLIFLDISGTLILSLTGNLGKLKFLKAEKSKLRSIDTNLHSLKHLYA